MELRTRPAELFYKIKSEPLFLLKDYSKDFFFLSFLAIALFNFRAHQPFQFSVTSILYFVAAIPAGWMVASFLHNTGHQNVSKGLLNKIVGEFVGNFVGYGFHNFIMVHMLHHLYSDQKFDPVNPSGMSFLKYLVSPNRYMIKYTKVFLREAHREHKNYETILLSQTIVFYLNMGLRLVCWYLLFGPTLFVFFYLPAVLSNITILAHINYVCHRDLPDGSVEVFNLDHNLYYKIANFITIGGYYHKNHHQNFNLFDPRKLQKKKARLFTIQSSERIPEYILSKEQNMLSLRRYFNLDQVWEERRNA